MNCRAAKKHMMQYIEGMLDGGTKTQFEQHLTSCESCREECKAIARMQKVLQGAAPETIEPAPDLWARVNARIQPLQPIRATRPWWKSAPAIGAVAMALIGIAIIPMYYNSSRQMMVATKTTSRDMLAAPGMKGMPGMPGMGGGAPQMAPANPSGGAGEAEAYQSINKKKIPDIKLRKPKPAASVMIAKVPLVDSNSTTDRDALVEKGENRHKEVEAKLNVAVPTLDPSILAKTRSEAANGSLRMTKAAPLRLFQEADKKDPNSRLNAVVPAPPANTPGELKSTLPAYSEVAKAAPQNTLTMPGGPGGAVMNESAAAVKPAPGMAGTPGMPGMGAPAMDKVNSDFLSTSGTQAKVSDMGSQVVPTPYGMIAVLEFQVKAGKKEAAISQADKLHKMQKVDQKTWYRLGEMEEKLGRIPKALEAYRKSTDGSDKEIARKASIQIKRLTRIIND